MTALRHAAQQALEALEWFNKYGSEEHGPSLRGAEGHLRAALAEPTVQTVAWYHVPCPPSIYGAAEPPCATGECIPGKCQICQFEEGTDR